MGWSSDSLGLQAPRFNVLQASSRVGQGKLRNLQPRPLRAVWGLRSRNVQDVSLWLAGHRDPGPRKPQAEHTQTSASNPAPIPSPGTDEVVTRSRAWMPLPPMKTCRAV